MFFCRADVVPVTLIKQLLEVFSKTFRLQVNVGKSHVFFGGVSDNMKHELLHLMQFQKDLSS